MKVEKNTEKVWDKVWEGNTSEKKDVYEFNKERKSIHWKRMRKILIKKLGPLRGLRSIEIGSGAGMYSLILASEGVNVTLIDYSPKAIEAGKLLFKRNNLNATFIQKDALNMDKNLFSEFDISMSFGTAEHFSGKNRLKFIKTHFDVLRKGGLTFIAVPNKWNILYSIHKFLSELFGKWNFGEEHPFSQMEFNRIGKKLNYKFEFIGYTLFLDPFLTLKRIKKLLKIKQEFEIKKINNEVGTPLDKYFAKIITAVSQK